MNVLSLTAQCTVCIFKIVNLGVIVAGGLVYLTNSKYPDLIVGTIVFFIVGQGAFKILKLSK